MKDSDDGDDDGGDGSADISFMQFGQLTFLKVEQGGADMRSDSGEHFQMDYRSEEERREDAVCSTFSFRLLSVVQSVPCISLSVKTRYQFITIFYRRGAIAVCECECWVAAGKRGNQGSVEAIVAFRPAIQSAFIFVHIDSLKIDRFLQLALLRHFMTEALMVTTDAQLELICRVQFNIAMRKAGTGVFLL